MPKLPSFGLWDPEEIQIADQAQDWGETKDTAHTARGEKVLRAPPLHMWLVGIGFKTLGVNELAGRLPLAIFGLLSLYLTYRVGRRLFNEKAGLAAAFVLATTPVFLFQSRQLTSDIAFYACLIASAGGLASFVWPVDNKRCRMDLVMGGLGLVGGFLAKGLLLGTLFPLVCLFLAIRMSWKIPGPLSNLAQGVNGSQSNSEIASETDTTLGQTVRSEMGPLTMTIAIAVVLIGALYFVLGGGYLLLLGSHFHKISIPPTFETTIKTLGFSTYPWIAIAPIALALFVQTQRTSPNERTPDAFGKLLIVLLVVVGCALAALWVTVSGEIRYPALPWLAIAVGVFCFDAWKTRSTHPVWAVFAGIIILVLQQDFFVAPQSLALSHLIQSAKFPSELDVQTAMRLFGVLFALVFFLALRGAPGEIAKHHDGLSNKFLRLLIVPLNFLIRLCNYVGAALRIWNGPKNQGYWVTVVLLAFAFAAWCSWYLTPNLSLHMSNKALFQTYHQCKQGDEKLSQYMVSGKGASYYNQGEVEQIKSQDILFKLLREQKRAFVLIPAGQLAPIDRAARQVDLSYYVLDDRNSQFVIMSNKLEGKCDRDLNPLRRWVVKKRPNPHKLIKANFENKVELLGYNVPDVVTRGGKFRITLFFHVKSSMPSNYKVFIHFDQPASRFHGDHVPLDGKYPTQYWLPGDFIIDHYDVDLPILTTPSGTYTMNMGFWLGSERMKVLSGPADSSNRVRLGTLRVR
ncbi:MAG: glycosyltransferase family 39 protein [Pseudomonadota bacterium]